MVALLVRPGLRTLDRALDAVESEPVRPGSDASCEARWSVFEQRAIASVRRAVISALLSGDADEPFPELEQACGRTVLGAAAVLATAVDRAQYAVDAARHRGDVPTSELHPAACALRRESVRLVEVVETGDWADLVRPGADPPVSTPARPPRSGLPEVAVSASVWRDPETLLGAMCDAFAPIASGRSDRPLGTFLEALLSRGRVSVVPAGLFLPQAVHPDQDEIGPEHGMWTGALRGPATVPLSSWGLSPLASGKRLFSADRGLVVEQHSSDGCVVPRSEPPRWSPTWAPPASAAVPRRPASSFRHRLFEPRRIGIGVDVGPGTLSAVVVDRAGEILRREQRTVPGTEADGVAKEVARYVADLAGEDSKRRGGRRDAAVGLAIGAPLTDDGASVRFYRKRVFRADGETRLPAWENFPLRDRLEDELDRPVRLFNDADAVAIRELTTPGAPSRHAVLLLREGIGSAVVLDGQLLPVAGEIGNAPLFGEGGTDCDCGARGCLEASCGLVGVVSDARLHHDDPAVILGIDDVVREYLDEHGNVRDKLGEPLRRSAVGLARAAALLVSVFGPLETLRVCAPGALIDGRSHASEEFTARVEQFGEYLGRASPRDCELRFCEDDPWSSAHGAALGALLRPS